VYDATYPPAFLNMNRSNLRALEGWSANYMRSEHEDTHVVDVTITFQRG
jgi:hypothetical protein